MIILRQRRYKSRCARMDFISDLATLFYVRSSQEIDETQPFFYSLIFHRTL